MVLTRLVIKYFLIGYNVAEKYLMLFLLARIHVLLLTISVCDISDLIKISMWMLQHPKDDGLKGKVARCFMQHREGSYSQIK